MSERTGIVRTPETNPPVSGRLDGLPACVGCGRLPREDEPIEEWSDKPRMWFVRTDKYTHERFFACSRDCIDRAGDATGMTKVVLPW